MPPKKSGVRLKQSRAFFPLVHRAIVANHVVSPGICPGLIMNRRGFDSISIDRAIVTSPIKCGVVNIVCVDNSGI